MKLKVWLAALVVGLTANVGLAARGGASTSACVYQTFTPGTSGQCVKDIQGMLDYAEKAGLTVDGLYGPLTTNAVHWFQVVWGVPSKYYVAGTTNYVTWVVLCGATSNAPYLSASYLYWLNAGCWNTN